MACCTAVKECIEAEMDLALLELVNSTLFGVLKPGEVLLIPGGAPHAAETLDSSFMVAMNDHTFPALDEILRACQAVKSCWVDGKGLGGKDVEWLGHTLQMHEVALENLKKRSLARKDIPFLEAFACDKQRYCQRVRDFTKQHPYLLSVFPSALCPDGDDRDEL